MIFFWPIHFLADPFFCGVLFVLVWIVVVVVGVGVSFVSSHHISRCRVASMQEQAHVEDFFFFYVRAFVGDDVSIDHVEGWAQGAMDEANWFPRGKGWKLFVLFPRHRFHDNLTLVESQSKNEKIKERFFHFLIFALFLRKRFFYDYFPFF